MVDDQQDEVTEDAVEENDTETVEDEATDEGAEDLGDKGKQALERMKTRLKAERDRRVAAEKKLADTAGDDEATKAKHEAETQALAKANGRILRSEIKAAAKGVLADPADAFKFIDLDQFEVDDDGNVDEDEVAAAIADLIKTKPYLAAAQGRQSRFTGTADQGARNAAQTSNDRQLTQADVSKLYAERKYDEIAAAQAAGRISSLFGATS